jgi:excinuclease ABC subunit A
LAYLNDRTFSELLNLPLVEARQEIEAWESRTDFPTAVREYLLPEITRRLAVLEELGLAYLTGDRAAATLSQGEWQRVRLGACLSLELTDGCYVLDEPTNGLHACDVGSVLRVLKRLRQQGNTVVVVDHDLQAITAADWQIDLGPGAGQRGGEVLFEGPPERLASDSSLSSPTARGLKACDRRPVENRLASSPQDGSPVDSPWLEFAVPRVRNLHEGTARIPLSQLTCLVGVSGSGKSTLLNEVLAPGIQALVNPRAPAASSTTVLSRIRTLSAERGRSSRSCVATLLGIWDGVRRLYARTKEAKLRGFGPRRFSYLSAEGWCPRCHGRGTVSLAETTVEADCPACNGRRFGPQTLTVTYRGLSIGDCLLQTVSELAEFFGSFEKLSLPLRELEAIGLGYLPLGQPTAHLSSGERQRIGLARELSQRDSRPAAFLLDEPTTGLHVADVEQLTASLRRIVEAGHTVIAADHHLTLVASSDWLIEVGPGGGTSGGRLIAQGDPTEVAKLSTPTGFALRTSPKEMASRG